MGTGFPKGLGVVPILILAVGCGVHDRLKQVETVSNMGSVVIEIAKARSAKGAELTDEEARKVIESSVRGDDGWGHRLLYFSKGSGPSFMWVLISPGSDGKLDFEQTNKYFEQQPEEIRGRFARDVVFSNGQSHHKRRQLRRGRTRFRDYRKSSAPRSTKSLSAKGINRRTPNPQ